jgi:hypothetical protein
MSKHNCDKNLVELQCYIKKKLISWFYQIAGLFWNLNLT